ncbi:HPr family phosphocarrier protein [Shouchella shacheensis]|uniref:HPr family phosphocarrier protein n=1 Tax=Shouchella shacheensis TaxID=1649580 RepID=UPI000ADDA97F|nr:HPr family phosphocarrier protein [Shouchella shacheensis]
MEKEVNVQLKDGLHAKKAADFVAKSSQYASDVFIIKGSLRVNAKSLLGLTSAAIRKGQTVTLQSEGKDEEEALRDLGQFLSGVDE